MSFTISTNRTQGADEADAITDAYPDRGRIPFRLRIGVTGHRTLTNSELIAGRVREALDRVRALITPTSTTRVVFTAVSSLAEGADRIVAREVLQTEEGQLEVVLPFSRQTYVKDFRDPTSRADYEELLAHAQQVDEHAHTSVDPNEGYVRAGQAVVDRSDVLIAIWDGLPAMGRGGTAEIVSYARRHEKTIILISADAGTLGIELGHGYQSEALVLLDQFNRESIRGAAGAQALQEARRSFSGPPEMTALGRTEAEQLSKWIEPYFVRADYLAKRYRVRFYRLTDLLYIAASAAVLVVAVQSFFFHEALWIVWSEVALLLALLVVVVYGRRVRLQRRWLSYRFLAERLRSAYYLAAIGTAERSESSFGGIDTADEWIQRALADVWSRRPSVTETQPERLRTLLAEAWIGRQLDYYSDAARSQRWRHRATIYGVYVLFAVTIGAAVAHSLGAGKDHSWGHLFSVLSITLPAIAASLSGLAAHHEYMRNSEQYARVTRSLTRLQEQLRTASDLKSIRQRANEAETTLREENRGWLRIMRFHDFEIHV